MVRNIRKFIADESGVTAIEYGLIAALVAVAAIAGFNSLGGQISSSFTSVGTKLVVS